MRAQSQKITKWTGVGGPAMAAEGLETIANYEQLHIIGVWDALLSYRRLKQLLNHIVTTICKTRPEVIYTVDSKGFSLKNIAGRDERAGAGLLQSFRSYYLGLWRRAERYIC